MSEYKKSNACAIHHRAIVLAVYAIINIVLPFFSMNSTLIVLGTWLFLFGWVTDGDKVQWNNRSFDTQDFTYFIHPLWPRMDSAPDSTQTKSGYS